jgi:hypothetical protein
VDERGGEKTAVKRAEEDSERQDSPPLDRQVGSGPDPIEAALAEALHRAARAEAWDAVQALTAELRARREARLNVVVLDTRRGRGKG